MKYSTREVIETLKLFASEIPIKREDIISARRTNSEYIQLHGRIISSEELAKIRLQLLFVLKKRGYLREEDSGYKITPRGHLLLYQYEEGVKKYGKKNVELVLSMEDNEIVYKIKIVKDHVKERVEKREKAERKTKRDLDTERLMEFLHASEYIKRIGRDENVLRLNTSLNFYRTKKEVEELVRVARKLGIEIEGDGTDTRKYTFYKNGNPIVSLISQKRKRGKGFKSYKPLEIEVNLKHSVEAKNLLEHLFEKLTQKPLLS